MDPFNGFLVPGPTIESSHVTSVRYAGEIDLYYSFLTMGTMLIIYMVRDSDI